MSTAPTSIPPKQGKGKKEKKRTQPQQNERLKIVVRRLPPNLPEDIFWQSVLPWVTEETTTWKLFYPGKPSKRLNKESTPSRAYIAFKSEEQLALFSHQYGGHIFRDKNGVESQAVVEFAPHPKVPSDKKKADSRNGTIEKDEDYISFIESLKAAENVEPISIEALIASSQPPPPPKTTPLLEALKAEKSAAKDKESILRNHAHYKQGGDASSRKEDKKRATKAAAPPVPPLKVATDAQASKLPPTPSVSKKYKRVHSQVADVQSSGGITVNPNKARNMAPSPKPTAQNPYSAGPSLQSPRLPKPPKPLRQAQSTKAVAASTSAVIGEETSTSAFANIGQPATTSRADPPRRARPVIASRQFEAALNIAGLATSASDRRKREKADDITSSSTTVDGSSATSPRMSKEEQFTISDSRTAQTTNLEIEKDKSFAKSLPPSPRKDRQKRGGRPGGSVHAATQSSDANTNAPLIKIPSILQRSDTTTSPAPIIVPKQLSSHADSSVVESPTKSNVYLPPPSPIAITGGSTSPPRGRGRRGRGGGRGGRGGGVIRGGQAAATSSRDSG